MNTKTDSFSHNLTFLNNLILIIDLTLPDLVPWFDSLFPWPITLYQQVSIGIQVTFYPYASSFH
jgi:hypothetical protein